MFFLKKNLDWIVVIILIIGGGGPIILICYMCLRKIAKR